MGGGSSGRKDLLKLLETMQLSEPLEEDAVHPVCGGLERVALLVHDGQQIVQCPPVHHHLKSLLTAANGGTCLLKQFVQSAGVKKRGKTSICLEASNKTLDSFFQEC